MNNTNIINLGKYFHDFSDTAAAIENCDLIISTDSAVLNLAGAMGKKTFGLFEQYPELGWYKLDGKDVGWYKSVKPFRIKYGKDFNIEINEITNLIKNLIKKDKRFLSK